MKKQDLDKFKKRLLDERDKIIQAKNNKAGQEISNTQSGDEADMASAEMELDAMYQGDQRGHNMLQDIQDALQKIEDGTYGECENCGEDISIARLEANPMAKLCVDCKSEEEVREKKYAKSSNTMNSYDDEQ
ncbi:MAG: TraR/DksA family transcriptional regulator [Bdellovibrionota bacterium]|nr:TraR/DksA family transcriptional regulator [Pseudomonadota bacterium]MDY6089915.1 TraR/DksA family transcriptional regulator [Bdellovibrionota bacterium]